MMNFREELHKVKHGPICNIGGDKEQNTQQTTQNYDQRQVNTSNVTTTNTLDGGAIQGAIDLAKKALDVNSTQTTHAYDYADNIFHAATDYANSNDARAFNAYDRAAAITNDALLTARQAYKESAGQLKEAYADAKGTTDAQSKIILAVLVVAGVAVVAALKG